MMTTTVTCDRTYVAGVSGRARAVGSGRAGERLNPEDRPSVVGRRPQIRGVRVHAGARARSGAEADLPREEGRKEEARQHGKHELS